MEVEDQQFTVPLAGLGLGRVGQLHRLEIPVSKELSDLGMIVEQ